MPFPFLRPAGAAPWAVALLASLALLWAAPAPAQQEPWVVRPPTPELALGREAAPAPLAWEEGETRTFLSRPRRVFQATLETAVTGWAVSALERREIRQTRIRFEEQREGKLVPVAWLQHVGNTEVALLEPGDPRLTDPGPALSDSLLPWPNPCALSFHELDRPLDADLDDRMELVVRFFAAVGDPAAAGLLFVQEGDDGRLRLLPPAEFIGTIRFAEGRVTAIHWDAEERSPTLEGRFLPLHRCRFLAEVGIRGTSECDACCQMPVLFQRDPHGVFRPVYVREVQGSLLPRVQADLNLVHSGESDPMATGEQVALARAAAFFYLTGQGQETIRESLAKALGPRGDQAGVRLLLNRLAKYFLQEPADP